MENENIRAGLYIRVSTFQQVEKDSLNTQEERLIEYCKSNSISEYKIYRDAGVSAKDIKRESLGQLLDDIKGGLINAVFVTKLDRITRSIANLLELVKYFEEYNVQFKSQSEDIDTKSSLGRFFLNLIGLLAQLEREITAERVSVDMFHRATQGKWNGGVVPYGYTTYNRFLVDNGDKYSSKTELRKTAAKLCPSSKKLYIDPIEAKTVKLLFERFKKLNSIRGTTHFLNDSGIRTRNNKLWASSSIHRILTNPMYIGKITYGKRKTDTSSGKLLHRDPKDWTIVDGEQEGFIEVGLFEKVQEMLKSNSKKPVRSGRFYLLRGILKCKKCGGKLHGYTYTKKNGKQYSYYKCWNNQQKGKVACSGNSIPAEKFEEFIIATLIEQSKNKQLLNDKKKILETIKNQDNFQLHRDSIDNLKKQNKKTVYRLERLMSLYEDGGIEKEDFTPRYIKLKDEISSIRRKITDISQTIDNTDILHISVEESFDKLMSFEESWDILDDKGKKLRIDSIVKDIIADKETVEINLYFDSFNKVYNMLRDSWPQQA